MPTSLLGGAVLATGAFAIVHILSRIFSLLRVLRSLKGCPGGKIIWLHPFRTLAIVTGPFFPLVGHLGNYYNGFSVYKKIGSTCISSVQFWTSMPTFWLADAEAIKIVSADRRTFPKDVVAYEAINIYGDNLVGTEGSEWRRHRAVAKPAFNEANNALVWSETIRVINQWFDKLNATQDNSRVDIVAAMAQITLLVISSAGFGRRVSWTEDSLEEPPAGHELTFRSAVSAAVESILVKALTPEWLYSTTEFIYFPFVSPLLQHTKRAFEALRMHMLDVISLSRARFSGGEAADGAALLRNLTEANMSSEGDYKRLTDEELLSNTFTFLLAGHETSAHTLSFCIILLALYPDIQSRIYEEVTQLWPDGVPTDATPSSYKEDIPKLVYTNAVFHETLRHYPAVPRLAKLVDSDTTLPAKRFTVPSKNTTGSAPEAEKFSVHLPVGSIVVVDILALQMNPLYWGDDVNKFKPERFIDTDTYRWPRDAFLAFSSGARSCIGQRFAITESLCILASIVRKYEIVVPDDIKFKPHDEQEKFLLRWIPGVTTTPTNATVRLQRR